MEALFEYRHELAIGREILQALLLAYCLWRSV